MKKLVLVYIKYKLVTCFDVHIVYGLIYCSMSCNVYHHHNIQSIMLASCFDVHIEYGLFV
jgi:hypothetical protein